MPLGSPIPPASKVPIELGDLQETMLITLWARAVESQRPDALTVDAKACALVEAIDYDFDRFKRGWKSQIGVAVRDRYIDRLVLDFITQHPEARIINFGAGLDTRFFRLDNGHLRWIDVDLPDAIALRSHLIEPIDRLTFISVEDDSLEWMERVQSEGKRPTMLIAEGVLMFFDRRNVERLFNRFAETFPSGSMIFDLIGPLMVRFPFLHDTLPKTKAKFRWGARSMQEAATLSERLELLSVRSMLDECPVRWRWMKWCRFAPFLHRQFFVAHTQVVG